MSCLDVRDRLSEHALGVLPADQAGEVERHLDSCPGCRKEFAELSTGAQYLGLGLPPAQPPLALEHRVVERVGAAASRRKPSRRRSALVLLAAALGAAALAAGAVGWAVVERGQVQDLKQQFDSTKHRADNLAALVRDLQQVLGSRGKVSEATLFAPAPVKQPENQGVGTVVVIANPNGTGGIQIEVVTSLPAERAPYWVTLSDAAGNDLVVGRLRANVGGGYSMLHLFTATPARPDSLELGNATSVSVADASGTPTLSGVLNPFAG